MRVLIVDDEEPIRFVLRGWLEPEGLTIVEAESAEEALTLATAGDPAAVAFCDLRLPGEDGLWLAEQLQKLSPDTAVVMTTGVHEFDAAVRSLKSGVVDYLTKPYPRERFIEAYRRAFIAHHSRRALTMMHRELEHRQAQISQALAELELNATSSLEAMLAILRLRDHESADHARRVAHLALNLAMTLHIGEPQLSEIERAALLHNLGRLALPDYLLTKREDTLTAEERTRLQSYPLHGYAMLKNVPFLAAANKIALSTHEKYDGSGFPHGLVGDSIPLEARIIGTANAFDELTSGLQGEQVTPARALEVMTTERATEFDPLALGALKMLQPSAVPTLP
jgi:response regulator RpfG family c-di-GMP phosphodiesterase